MPVRSLIARLMTPHLLHWYSRTAATSCCLLVGRCSSPAPSDRCLRASWTTTGSRGPQAIPQGREAPLTRAAARWQPVQQANGGGRWVQGPAGQRSVKAVVRPRADLEADQDKPATALEGRSRTAQVSLR